MRRFLARRSSRIRRGQALVELALVLLILLAILIAGIDAIQVAMTNYSVGQAVRAAAHRGAITGGNIQDARQAAIDVLNAGMTTTADKATITITCTPPSGLSGCPRYSAFTVHIAYSDSVWAPDPLGIFRHFTATASSTRTTEADQQGGDSAGSPQPPSEPPPTQPTPISSPPCNPGVICLPPVTIQGQPAGAPQGLPGSSTLLPGAQP
ncbi:MAG: hypothetical protein KatS3mg057_1653 [Herpetosiphonaceae bacterium]|nr:MAG: hypothetical protein KatS3mg057_1653 [Herpetosiphonaceae bacterium]